MIFVVKIKYWNHLVTKSICLCNHKRQIKLFFFNAGSLIHKHINSFCLPKVVKLLFTVPWAKCKDCASLEYYFKLFDNIL